VSTVPRDKARQCALLKAELLAAARAAVAKLTDEQCEVIYVEIEQGRCGSRADERAAAGRRARSPGQGTATRC